jgi:hypothetical protein
MRQAETPAYAFGIAPASQDNKAKVAEYKKERDYHRPCCGGWVALQAEGYTNDGHQSKRQPCSLARKHEPDNSTMSPGTIHGTNQSKPQYHDKDIKWEAKYIYRNFHNWR